MAGLSKRRGKWYARVSIWDGNRQKEKQIPLKTENKTEARERLAQVVRVENDIKEGIDFEFPWMNCCSTASVKYLTVEELAEKFLKERRANGLAQTTLQRNVYSFNALTDVVGKTHPVTRITPTTLNTFKEHFIGKHSAAGININLRLIKTFLGWCEDRGFIDRAPKVEMVKTTTPLPSYITDAEFAELMKLNDLAQHYKRAFYFYRETGLRLSEPFYGKLDGSWLVIPAEFTKQKAEREIYLADELIPIWCEMKSRFETRAGKAKWFTQQYSKQFRLACRRLNIKQKFHDLRHTFAIRRWLETGDIYLVKSEMGHSSVKSTEGYAQFSPKRLAQDFPSLAHHFRDRLSSSKKRTMDTITMDTYEVLSTV